VSSLAHEARKTNIVAAVNQTSSAFAEPVPGNKLSQLADAGSGLPDRTESTSKVTGHGLSTSRKTPVIVNTSESVIPFQ
jgi:hypothetical protein